MDRLYCGYVRDDIFRNLDKNMEPVFEVSEINVLKHSDDLKYFVVDGYYFVGVNHSTDWFSSQYLDRELRINNGTVYYSFDRNKCMNFVYKRHQTFKSNVERYIERLQEAKTYSVKVS